jgi:hypothetical protein
MKQKTVRKLKVHHKVQSRAWNSYKDTPWLNMSGLWLAKAGFSIGSMVEVSISENQLIIKKASHGN